MKISKSKKELASIIRENGGWCDGAHWMSQDRDGGVYSFVGGKPVRHKDMWCLKSSSEKIGWKFAHAGAIKNWHQTILSRDEHFHLYPAPDAKTEFCESVMRSIPEPEAKPTIEQMAADYQAKLGIATRAQEEADAHRCGAEVALSKLEIAMKEVGFKIEPITTKQESELVITDWRDLKVGDIIQCVGSWEKEKTDGMQLPVTALEGHHYNGDLPIRVEVPGISCPGTWGINFKFIRRP